MPTIAVDSRTLYASCETVKIDARISPQFFLDGLVFFLLYTQQSFSVCYCVCPVNSMDMLLLSLGQQ